MECGFFLDIVIGQSTSVLELLSSENQTLLIWGNPLLVLNLGLDVVDSVRRFHLKGDGLSSNYRRMIRISSSSLKRRKKESQKGREEEKKARLKELR